MENINKYNAENILAIIRYYNRFPIPRLIERIIELESDKNLEDIVNMEKSGS